MTTCTEQWTDEIGCYPSDRPHLCEVAIPHHAFHRCSCSAWFQTKPDYHAADVLLGRLPVLSPLTLESLQRAAEKSLVTAFMTPDCEELPR